MRIKKLYNNVFWFIILIISLYIYTLDALYSDFKVILTNLLILIFSLVFMVNGDKYNYSLNKVFMLFSFFFFAIAPVLQYQYGTVFWGGTNFNNYSYYRLNIIILFILISYQGLYHIFSKLKIKRMENFEKIKCNNRKLSGSILILLSTISLFITLHFNNYNLTNILFRAGSDIGRLSVNQSIYLIYSNFIRPIPAISLIFFKKYGLKNKKLEILLVMFVLISNFPTSAARFYIATLYLPLLIVYIKQFNNKYLLFNKILIVGLLIAFPLLDQVRRINSFSDMKITLDFQMFLQGHFDSYQMFMRVVDNNFITMGKQLLTALLFFIPRSIWTNKSVGSGHLIAYTCGFSYDNISMNYFGEGYINFGYIGILIFTIVIAFINAKLDKMYWLSLEKHNWISVFYLFFLGLEFFILRGDLLSSFAYTTGIMTSVLLVFKLATKDVYDKLKK